MLVNGPPVPGVFWFSTSFTLHPMVMVIFSLLNLDIGHRWYDAMTTYMPFVNLINLAGGKSRNSSTVNFCYVDTYVFSLGVCVAMWLSVGFLLVVHQ